MSFSQHERKRLAALADELIPAATGQFSASQADVSGSGLDQVLATSPEMASGLREVLALAADADAKAAVALLSEKHRAEFFVLCEFAAGAYFLNQVVRDAIGYAGQTARPIDTQPDYLDDGLLESVIQRGPIYRPTPK
jgi:hypothetical protein